MADRRIYMYKIIQIYPGGTPTWLATMTGFESSTRLGETRFKENGYC